MIDRSKEKHYMDDLCLCGHSWEDHFVNERNKQIWCGNDGSLTNDWNDCDCRNFQLDNLATIEYNAIRRNLI